MRLNLGSGLDAKKDGWTNVDIRPFSGVDVVADVRAIPFPDQSADEILAQDVLEHLPIKSVKPTLEEWARVLKPGGRLTIRLPHLLKICRKAMAGALRAGEVIELIYGSQDYGGDDHTANFHKSGLLEDQLRSYLEEVGFAVESIEDMKDQHNLQAVAYRA